MTVSAGIVRGEAALDLCYQEDARAEVDANFVMTGEGDFVELQTTAEAQPLRADQFDLLLGLAKAGVGQLVATQALALGDRLALVMRRA